MGEANRPDAAGNDGAAALLAQSLGGYLGRVASPAPAPGGGSVVGVAGALAAALGEMVCRLGPPRLAATDEELAVGELATTGERLAALRGRLVALAAADEAAYAGYRAAAALPRTGSDEQIARTAAMAAALAEAIAVPLATAEGCGELLAALEGVARLGKPALRSDVRIAAALADAALRGALATVRGNLGGEDDDRAVATAARADAAERAGAAALAAVHAALDAPKLAAG